MICLVLQGVVVLVLTELLIIGGGLGRLFVRDQVRTQVQAISVNKMKMVQQLTRNSSFFMKP